MNTHIYSYDYCKRCVLSVGGAVSKSLRPNLLFLKCQMIHKVNRVPCNIPVTMYVIHAVQFVPGRTTSEYTNKAVPGVCNIIIGILKAPTVYAV